MGIPYGCLVLTGGVSGFLDVPWVLVVVYHESWRFLGLYLWYITLPYCYSCGIMISCICFVVTCGYHDFLYLLCGYFGVFMSLFSRQCYCAIGRSRTGVWLLFLGITIFCGYFPVFWGHHYILCMFCDYVCDSSFASVYVVLRSLVGDHDFSMLFCGGGPQWTGRGHGAIIIGSEACHDISDP